MTLLKPEHFQIDWNMGAKACLRDPRKVEIDHQLQGLRPESFYFLLFETTENDSPLDCKEIQPVHSKGDQSWVLIGRTDAEAETPILWPPDVKSWLIWKDPDAGKDWRREEKGSKEDEMVGWHHWLSGYEWVWAKSRSWWSTGNPGVLHSVGLQRVDWAPE